MIQLTIINQNGQFVADSREIAEMTNTRHADLLEKIDFYVQYLTNGKFRSLDFFIPGAYQDTKGETRRKYDCTRKGCDMIANKMTGEKGVWFTAAYVTKFEEMEKAQRDPIPQTFAEALRLAADQAEKIEVLQLQNAQKEQIINEMQPKATYYDLVLQSKSAMAIGKIAKDYGMSAKALNKKLHELGIQYKQGDCWLLYQNYADKGYTQSKTQIVNDEYSKLHTYWTQKGRLFIYELLKREGTLPVIEREEAS